MRRLVFFVYGVVCYALFFGTFLYMIGFLGNLVVPKSIDTGAQGPALIAVFINTMLIALFGLQHSIMARPGFKQRWISWLPRPIERSTYVLITALLLLLIFNQWRPVPATVWSLQGSGELLTRGLFFAGFGLVLYSSFLIDHFDLFGLRQVFLHLRGREYTHPDFAVPTLYKLIRHPLYLGWFLAFWATPVMTVGHLLFAALMSGYILIAIPLEERDLSFFLGEDYRRYRERTPMFLPWSKRRPDRATAPRVS
jgi:protein-S-isoprenylcysteine O-methyltransferase Ste14